MKLSTSEAEINVYAFYAYTKSPHNVMPHFRDLIITGFHCILIFCDCHNIIVQMTAAIHAATSTHQWSVMIPIALTVSFMQHCYYL